MYIAIHRTAEEVFECLKDDNTSEGSYRNNTVVRNLGIHVISFYPRLVFAIKSTFGIIGRNDTSYSTKQMFFFIFVA